VTRLLALLLLSVGGPALAQSAPPDLQPRLTGDPLLSRPPEEKEKPRLQEPARPPVAHDAITPASPAATAPTR
jgi:hypothetical protein